MKILMIVGFALIAMVVYVVFMFRKMKKMPEAPQSARVITLDNNNFQKHIGTGITLVDFWASWCMPCKMMAPILNDVAEATDGKATIGKLNVEDFKQIAARYEVRSIPTMIIFKNGKVMDRIVGVKPKEFLVNKLEWVKNK